MSIYDLLQQLNIKTVDSSFYSEHIDTWKSWYKGKVNSFHSYTLYNGKKRVKKERATLGMAKRVCEDWANLLFNEKTEFTTESDSLTVRAREILEANNFYVRANLLVELAFAFGTGAFVEYISEGAIKIDYVRADMIYPIAWDNGKITECAFASTRVMDGKKVIYVQLHLRNGGEYVIQNRLFDKKTGAPLPLPEGVAEEYGTKSPTPLFQIITPNIINNIDLDNPMGVSVFANSIDVLRGIDLVYDSYQNEFRLGKKRIIVPAGMAQMNSDETGLSPIFDDNDTEFYAMTDKSVTELKEIDMKLRSAEHTEGLQQQLNLFSDKCGLGTDRYIYRGGTAKTATEVISEKSSMFQNMRKHQLVLADALRGVVRAVLQLSGENYGGSVEIDFDDSIIHDTSTEFAQNMQLVASGIMPKYEFRMWWFNETEQQAMQKIADAPEAEE